jgi:hypothetical protein
MNDYLRKAVEKDERLPQAISPLSKMDAEIFGEIRELFAKLGKKKIVAILDLYKKKKDSVVLELLYDFNTNFNIYEEEKNSTIVDRDKKKYKIFIELSKQLTIEINQIKALQRYKIYKNKKFVYILFINPSEIEGYQTNIELEFESEKIRDDMYQKIKKILKKNGVEII